MPITSPVDFISGPSTASTPGNFTNGKTDSLTAMWASSRDSTAAYGASGWPSITRVATLASGSPSAFEAIYRLLPDRELDVDEPDDCERLRQRAGLSAQLPDLVVAQRVGRQRAR